MWRTKKTSKNKKKIKNKHSWNPKTQQSKTHEPKNLAIANHSAILLSALTKHKALMGRRLGKSYGFALGKSDGLSASGREDGLARMEEEREKIKGRRWASTEIWVGLRKKGKNKGGGWRLNLRKYERKKKEKKRPNWEFNHNFPTI